tara:strand:+ start:3473 stop:3604 length:132 start_codon:yes stop_codon:yes gene_type:complete
MDPTDSERTMQEEYEAACDEYHQWYIEQGQMEERAISEQVEND